MKRASIAAVALWAAACTPPDPAREIGVRELEAYWTVDSATAERVYIAAALRVRIENLTAEPMHTIQATATFRRKGEEHLDWGTAWESVTPPGKPLGPGESRLLVLRSDARYYSTGAPESFFAHAQFKDAVAKLYLRLGSSQWVAMGEALVERRIGTKSLP